MRRLVVLLSCVVLVDTSLYAALTPLLPDYADEFGLSKTASGLLLGTYGIGVLAAAIPAGVIASRWGPKRSVVAGLALIAVSSVVFAFAVDEWMLGGARIAQGIGSAATWAGALTWLVAAAPAEKRGQTIGTAMGAAVFGALVGPVLGAIADFAGPEATFTVFGGVVAAVALLSLREPGVAAEPQSLRSAAPAFRDRRLLAGLWVTLLPALLFGAFAISVSFRLDEAGWRASAIAAVFLAAAGLETVMNPLLGRAVDRRGHLLPIRVALTGSIAFALALAWATTPAALVPLAIAGAVAFGALYAPGMALVSESAQRAGLAQAIAWGVLNGAWAAGNVIGPAAAGAISEAGSDAATWLAVAGISAATLLAVRAYAARTAVAP